MPKGAGADGGPAEVKRLQRIIDRFFAAGKDDDKGEGR